MRSRIRFGVDATPSDEAAIRAAIRPLIAAEDYTVLIENPPLETDELGWRVSVAQPGKLVLLRVKIGTPPAGWAQAIQEALHATLIGTR